MIRKMVIIALVIFPALANASPKIVTSIKPLYSLALMVTDGTDAKVSLLVDSNFSEHSYALKPSQAKEIAEADVVFYIHKSHEVFLASTIKNKHEKMLELASAEGITLLKIRSGDTWEKHEHENEHEHEHGHGNEHEHEHGKEHEDLTIDTHIWLEPENAKIMLKTISAKLAEIDSANAQKYNKNTEAAIAEITKVANEIEKTTKHLRKKNFIVMHDAYQYFEKRFGLNAVGSIMLRPDEPLAIKNMAVIRKGIESGNIACVFSEPQFDDNALKNLTKGTKARLGVLDGLGISIPLEKNLYIDLLRSLSSSFNSCLGDAQ